MFKTVILFLAIVFLGCSPSQNNPISQPSPSSSVKVFVSTSTISTTIDGVKAEQPIIRVKAQIFSNPSSEIILINLDGREADTIIPSILGQEDDIPGYFTDGASAIGPRYKTGLFYRTYETGSYLKVSVITTLGELYDSIMIPSRPYITSPDTALPLKPDTALVLQCTGDADYYLVNIIKSGSNDTGSYQEDHFEAKIGLYDSAITAHSVTIPGSLLLEPGGYNTWILGFNMSLISEPDKQGGGVTGRIYAASGVSPIYLYRMYR